MTAIIGMDPSSRKLAAVYGDPNGTIRWDSITLPGKGISIEKVMDAHFWVQQLIYSLSPEPVHLFIEEPVVGKGGVYSTLVQAKMHGAVYLSAALHGAEVTAVNNAQVKKAVVGKGNATKPEIKKAMQQRWPSLLRNIHADQDLVDASMIYLFGQEALGLRRKVVRVRSQSRYSRAR